MESGYPEQHRTKSKLQSINQMIQNIKIYREEITKVRNDHLGQELEKASIQRKKLGRTTADIKPTIGDIGLIRNEDKADYDKYGVIQEIVSPQTLRIRTRHGIIDRPASITIPIVPHCLLQKE